MNAAADTASAGQVSGRLSDEQLKEVMRLIKGANSVELKLTVPASAHRATVQGLPLDPVEAQPRQIYFFDTPDLQLFRAGVVVRAHVSRAAGATRSSSCDRSSLTRSRRISRTTRHSTSRSTRCLAGSSARHRSRAAQRGRTSATLSVARSGSRRSSRRSNARSIASTRRQGSSSTRSRRSGRPSS